MVCPMSSVAFAYDAESEPVDSAPVEEKAGTVTVFNHSRYLTDEDIEELKENISASIGSPTGEEIPLDCIVTVEDVTNNNAATYRGVANRTYAATVTTSITTPDREEEVDTNAVKAIATIRMTWTDVLGIGNTLDNISGEIDIKKGTLTNGKVTYGDTHNQPLLQPYFHTGTADRYNEDVSYTSTNIAGRLHAHYQGWFEELPSTKPLLVCVGN